MSVDTATCDDCLAEVDDPSNRRYRYPFTNCTNCGPRYTIVRSVPYDRPATTMAGFAMCPACLGEYDDPADRRFHAQPNACPVCGPQLGWIDLQSGFESARDDALRAAVEALLAGKIIGVKGIGGYHLAVDATDANAVRELRRRKSRDDKPFAVMAADGEAAAALVEVDDATVQQLTSLRRPIVLAPRRHGSSVADAVAPGLPELGVMLPYTPAAPLVARRRRAAAGDDERQPQRRADRTRGRRRGNPSRVARRRSAVAQPADPHPVRRLGGPGRAWAIAGPPSLARSRTRTAGAAVRARGIDPRSRCRAQITIAVTKGPSVVPSHHIGDLEHLATYTSFLQAVEHLPALYGVRPEVVAHDLHPEYLSSKYAADLDLPAVAVQHHHAHVAACMVEHGRTEPVIGVAYRRSRLRARRDDVGWRGAGR